MGLEHADNAVIIHLTGGFQGCSHFCRMMGVVVNDHGTGSGTSGELEPAGRAGKLLQAFGRCGSIQTQEQTDCTGSQGIEHVVVARYRQIHMGKQLALMHDIEAVITMAVGDIFRIHICLRCGAEGNTGTVNAFHCL